MSLHLVVKYPLSKNNAQIYVSKYKLYLPTEDELRQELQWESAALNNSMNLE